MLILIAKAGNELWEKGVICPSSVVYGQDISDNVFQCHTTNAGIQVVAPVSELSSSGDERRGPSTFILTHDTNEYLIPAVDVLKVCGCLRDLLEEREESLKLSMDSYLFSCLLNEMAKSETYRRNVLKFFFYHPLTRRRIVNCEMPDKNGLGYHLQVVIILKWPDDLKIDFAWDGRMQSLMNERLELENLMAWLSTLGGAYSALGEDFHHCARIAGKISIHQLKIALSLGDPITSAKCKVYFSISLLQRGYLKQPIQIIRDQYKFAKSLHENLVDHRLINMCRGVWAKIQYLHREKKLGKKIILYSDDSDFKSTLRS